MLNLQQRLKLQQKLSPQQIQFVNLLQLNNLSLEQRIQSELEANPMLEETLELSTSAEEQDERGEGEEETDFDWEELLPSSDDDSYGYKVHVDTEERPERPLAAAVSMTEHLQAQLTLHDLTALQSLIATQVIGSIDEDGYLRREINSIIDDLLFTHGKYVTPEEIEYMLRRIQRLDPPGIGARDLRECLMVQLELLPEETPGRDTATKILSKYFEDFTMKRFARIRERLGVDNEVLRVAFEVVRRLNPKPGEGTLSSQENYITPDFEVRALEQGLEVSLIRSAGPKIQISPQYRAMLEQLTPKNLPIPRSGEAAKTRQFLKQRFDSARWFIDAVNQRRRTLLLVMRAIAEKQHDFFTLGPGHLKPLILADIAELIDMDISTVSRVVGGKYVQTDFGVYALKYFFSEGVATQGGEMVSNTEVKAILVDIIRQENKAAPLSDRKLAEYLNEQGFLIARRTISKYREQLSIPVARMRKEIVTP